MTNPRKLTAVAFMAQLSTAGKLADAQPVPIDRVTVTERWDGEKFVAQRLVWDGDQQRYVPEDEMLAAHDFDRYEEERFGHCDEPVWLPR